MLERIHVGTNLRGLPQRGQCPCLAVVRTYPQFPPYTVCTPHGPAFEPRDHGRWGYAMPWPNIPRAINRRTHLRVVHLRERQIVLPDLEIGMTERRYDLQLRDLAGLMVVGRE